MKDHVYAVTEIVGSSWQSVDDAIRNALRTGAKTLRHLNMVTGSQSFECNNAVINHPTGRQVHFFYEYATATAKEPL